MQTAVATSAFNLKHTSPHKLCILGPYCHRTKLVKKQNENKRLSTSTLNEDYATSHGFAELQSSTLKMEQERQKVHDRVKCKT